MAERVDIERVQKSALHIVLGNGYISYDNALKISNLETLEKRRDKLSLKFALKAEKHQKFKKWFKLNQKVLNTRNKKAQIL